MFFCSQLTFYFEIDEAENISWENRKNVYQIVVELSGKSTTACELEFRPSEVKTTLGCWVFSLHK